MKKILFTTSWDDGSVLDLRITHLLSKYGMKGTFYVPKMFDGNGGKFSAYERRLNNNEIKKISEEHEIGGHSLSHRSLIDLSNEEIEKEVLGSRDFLKEIIGFNPSMFCFPKGKFNDQILNVVKNGGFLGGRTTKKMALEKKAGEFLMDVTIICQPFPFRKIDENHYYWRRIFDPLLVYKPMVLSTSWLSLAKKIFKKSCTVGNYFHLYGHSWEIEKYGMWNDLEKFFVFVKKNENIQFLSNGELIKKI